MPKFLLIRHGESVWNGQRRIQGTRDLTLSQRGRRQADLLVRHLQARVRGPVAGIYTSLLRRAAETADRIAGAIQPPVIREPDVRVMSLGA